MIADLPEFRSGYVAIVGRPNVGKSTLLNSIIETKLSIVSPKPQTTRHRVLGIWNGASHQMIFLDTPGWLKPQGILQTSMRSSIMRALHEDADVVLFVVECATNSEEDTVLAELIRKINKPTVLALNKIDKAKGDTAEKKIPDALAALLGPQVNLVSVSAKTSQGLPELKNTLLSLLPLAAPYFPSDQITDRWERFYVAELIREGLLEEFHEEIPHASAVIVEEFVEKAGKKDHIEATVYTETESQLRILVGNRGSAIKRLGEKSRLKIEAFLNRPVFLGLRVKVHRRWRDDPSFLKKLNSDF